MEIVAHMAASDGPRRTPGAAALSAALAGPAGRVELDVFALDGRLVVAHDRREAARPGGLTLADALAIVVPSGRGLLADIKGAGVARLLGRAIADHELGLRTIVCGVLDEVELACRGSGATPAWTLPSGSFGRVTRRSRDRVRKAAVAGLEAGRLAAVSVEHRSVTADLVDDVHRAGGRVLAWTVDDLRTARRLAGLGVDELITNQPDLLAASIAAGSAQWSDG
ncbi:MAG TPA: glycerophosphodiester phosphodiesterase [Solirubrobacteraceae bacterium]|jgi:glycerophosphoryl diester phosphodiesterase|nr:glycerophosphodiester phosphodiesterase [Solirubrobacteraceae bacterium]